MLPPSSIKVPYEIYIEHYMGNSFSTATKKRFGIGGWKKRRHILKSYAFKKSGCLNR